MGLRDVLFLPRGVDRSDERSAWLRPWYIDAQTMYGATYAGQGHVSAIRASGQAVAPLDVRRDGLRYSDAGTAMVTVPPTSMSRLMTSIIESSVLTRRVTV
jgi:hypothetical protein